MEQRLKELRKKLGLNQEEFGLKIGLTRSAICNYENGSRAIMEQTIISICREFNVNRVWLVDGVGDMFTNLPETIIDELAMQFDLNDDERELVLDFCSLSKDDRSKLLQFLRHK